MDASRQQWLQWIEDRFSGKAVAEKGCARSTLESFLPAETYQEISTAFPQWAGQPDEFFELVAGGF
jgi:hypothetical protein